MRPARAAFTLIELMIVMVIIGILLAFILAASVSAIRSAEERATQALISKLETGMGDRLEALLTQQVDTTATAYNRMRDPWSRMQFGAGQSDPDSAKRLAVIARFDQVKTEFPDVFVVQGVSGLRYPLNFAQAPFPSGDLDKDVQFVNPVGGGDSQVLPVPSLGSGIFGASYTVLAAINKNLGKSTDPTTGQTGAGFGTKGYDMVDSNGNDFIDDLGESGGDASIATALANHKHVTARAEMLYAILVEGTGPFGSVFARDDFTEKEVKDTDQDGLPEFVDAWGNPLQFYRWPTLYNSDVQRGLRLIPTGDSDANGNAAYGLADAGGSAATPYGAGLLAAANLTGAYDPREQDPLDPNQQLMAPAWWSSANGFAAAFLPSGPLSAQASFFSCYFHQLLDPVTAAAPNGLGSSGSATQRYWDRSVLPASGLYPRRAFYSRFLILSGGPDGQPGVPYLTDRRGGPGDGLFTDAQLKALAASNYASGATAPMSYPLNGKYPVVQWLLNESQAAQATLNRTPDAWQMPILNAGTPGGDPYTNQLRADGLDDITNHNLGSSAMPAQ